MNAFRVSRAVGFIRMNPLSVYNCQLLLDDNTSTEPSEFFQVKTFLHRSKVLSDHTNVFGILVHIPIHGFGKLWRWNMYF
jgi:hypothetical protein